MYPDQVEIIDRGPDPEAIGFIKEVFRKKSTIALALLHVLFFACQATAAVYMTKLASTHSVSDSVISTQISAGMGVVTGIVLFVLAVVTVLTVAGYIAAYTKSRDPSPDVTPKIGLNLLFAAWFIALIGSVIVITVVFFFVYIGVWLNTPAMQALPDYALVLLGAAIFAVLCFITLFSPTARLRWLLGVRNTLNGKFPTMQGAKAYSAVSVIRAVIYGVFFIAMLMLSLMLTFTPLPDEIPASNRSVMLIAVYAASMIPFFGMIVQIVGASLPKSYRALADRYRSLYADFGYGYGDGFSPEDEFAYQQEEMRRTLPKYCPCCGTQNQQKDNFCRSCGNRIP